ncbi:hypothetical protein BURK1_02713 [Burkholderiales bacterium]|nr:hypothetical protein BURK1_02713 [Burkholderiales bacterium]
MGLLSGGDVELRLSRRALALALVAAASIAAFVIGMRWAIESAPAPALDSRPVSVPAAAQSAPAVASPRANAGGASPALPGLEVMVDRLEAKVRAGSGTADQWLLLGQTYRELGRDADALAAFERASALDPANATARAERDRARGTGRAGG